MNRPRRSRQIAVAFPTSVSHLEHSLRGVHDYMQQHEQWTLIVGTEIHFLPVRSLVGWEGDGVIAMINTEADLRAARRLPAPVVNISGAIAETGLPRVRLDYAASGRLAAETLLDCGFKRFAFNGLRQIWYTDQYARGFFETAEAHGGECFRHDSQSSIGNPRPWQHGVPELERWLVKLPKPIGLMAANDRRASIVIDACHRLGLRVPHDVAVIGADNDVLNCEQCDPPLTSIARNGRRIGYEVAALLDRLMNGKSPPRTDVIVPPEGVIKRGSTDVLALDDAKLRAAVAFARQHSAEPIGVDDLAAAAGVSRRWLEYAFRNTLRRSPHQFLDQLRVERARRLLEASNKQKLHRVAHACGFSGSKQLNAAFRRVTGHCARLRP
jgi:LacI family transcriptional regulator